MESTPCQSRYGEGYVMIWGYFNSKGKGTLSGCILCWIHEI